MCIRDSITSSAVLLQTSGLAVSASSTQEVYSAPQIGLDGPGCSEYLAGATIQDTCGRLLASTSRFSASSFQVLRPLTISGESGAAARYWRKPISGLSEKLSAMSW